MPRGSNNAAKTHCPRGHPLSGDNLRERMKKGRHGRLVRSRECLTCIREANKRDWAKKGGGHSRDDYLRYTYGITQEQYDRLLELQGGLCAACQLPPAPGKRLDVDHDHGCCPGRKSCGSCIRGLLCRRCNLILGYVGEDQVILMTIIDYLNRESGLANLLAMIERGELSRFQEGSRQWAS